MTSAGRSTAETLELLTETRRRVDQLADEWRSGQDAAAIERELNVLADRLAGLPSVAALLYGAVEWIKRGDPVDHRLEKLSDHLHGYTVGWEDAAAERNA